MAVIADTDSVYSVVVAAIFNQDNMNITCTYAFEKEIEYYKKTLELDPKNGLYMRRLGIALLKQKKIKKAVIYLKDSLNKVVNPYRTYKYLASANEMLKNYPEAIRYYKLALNLQPQDNLDWYRYGISLYMQKDYTNSIVAFNKALTYSDQEDHKFQALIKRRLAKVYIRLKSFNNAILNLQESLELNNKYLLARLDFASLLFKLKGRNKEGEHELSLVLKLEPDNCKALKLANKNGLTKYQKSWSQKCIEQK